MNVVTISAWPVPRWPITSPGWISRQIQASPANADLRAAFVQLLCLAGNWTRALTQLKSWLALKPQAQPTVTLLEQAIDGELQRAKR